MEWPRVVDILWVLTEGEEVEWLKQGRVVL